MNGRVAITGIGIVSSLGNDFQTVGESLLLGRSGLVTVPEWREMGLRCWVAGSVDLAKAAASSRLSKRSLATMGDVSAFCALAAEQAIADAGLDEGFLGSPDFGCLVGSGIGCMGTIYQGAKLVHEGKARRVRPYSVLQSMSSAPSAHLVQAFGIRGRSYSISAACATSANTIGHAFELIRRGELRGALAGGGEEVNLYLASAFNALRTALSTRWNEKPALASRPFDSAEERASFSAAARASWCSKNGAALWSEAPSSREKCWATRRIPIPSIRYSPSRKVWRRANA